MGFVDADGYLFLVDRATFMIVSGGVNIYPQEIEDVLVGHPKVADVAVFGVPDEDFGEQVKAVVQPMPGVEAYDAVVSGSTASPRLSGVSWNRSLPAGGSVTVLIRARGGAGLPLLSCEAI